MDGRLNVQSTPDGGASLPNPKNTLNESSNTQPYLFFLAGTLFLLWQGNDGRLNCRQSNDNGANFTNKVTIGEKSGSHPAMAAGADGLLFLSWRGLDDNLNQIVSETGTTNGFATVPSFKRRFYDTSPNGPSLCLFNGRMFVTWQGSDSDNHINVAILNRGSVAVYGPLK